MKEIQENNQIALLYCDEKGEVNEKYNPKVKAKRTVKLNQWLITVEYKTYVSLPKVKAIIQRTKMTLPIDKTIPVLLWSIDKIEVNCGL